jgi:hypothetical protein
MSNTAIMELSNVLYDIKDKINDGEYKTIMDLMLKINNNPSPTNINVNIDNININMVESKNGTENMEEIFDDLSTNHPETLEMLERLGFIHQSDYDKMEDWAYYHNFIHSDNMDDYTFNDNIPNEIEQIEDIDYGWGLDIVDAIVKLITTNGDVRHRILRNISINDFKEYFKNKMVDADITCNDEESNKNYEKMYKFMSDLFDINPYNYKKIQKDLIGYKDYRDENIPCPKCKRTNYDILQKKPNCDFMCDICEEIEKIKKEYKEKEDGKNCPCCVFSKTIDVLKLGKNITDEDEKEKYENDKKEFLSNLLVLEKEDLLRGTIRNDMDFNYFLDYVLSDDGDDILESVSNRLNATLSYLKHLKNHEMPPKNILKKILNGVNRELRREDICRSQMIYLLHYKEKIFNIKKFMNRKTITI